MQENGSNYSTSLIRHHGNQRKVASTCLSPKTKQATTRASVNPEFSTRKLSCRNKEELNPCPRKENNKRLQIVYFLKKN